MRKNLVQHESNEAQVLAEADARHIWHPFTRRDDQDPPLLIHSGAGAVLRTRDGREIIDAISSWWVNLFGHGRQEIAGAIEAQANTLEQVLFAGYTHEPAIRLAQSLTGMLPDSLARVFFSDDGSTAVEVALKLAWQYWQNLGEARRSRIVVFEGAYHGDTVGAMSAGASSGFFAPWSRQLIPCEAMPWPATWDQDPEADARESAALETVRRFLARHGDSVAAMLMEPMVQGASGMRMVRPSFVQTVVNEFRRAGALIVFDEIMTGFGRTGAMFAMNHAGVVPDMICLSKGLTAGFLPLAVTVVEEKIFASFGSGDGAGLFAHGHSYTANPLGCAAAIASLGLLQEEATIAAWKRIEAGHRAGLNLLAGIPGCVRGRVLGTIAAVDLHVDDPGYGSSAGRRLGTWFRRQHSRPRSVLIRPLGNVVYLLPPYCIEAEELNFAWREVARGIHEALPGL